jgi:perosamine synthetase
MVTESDELCEKLKLLRSHGRAENANYFTTGEYMDYVTLGYNFRMADIVAALGISQLKKVDKLIKLRRDLAAYMTSLLSGVEDIIIPSFPENIYHVYQEYYVRIKSGEKTRNALKSYLGERGIGTRISFPPVHKSKFYKEVLGYNDNLKNTEVISSSALTLPLYPSLTEQEIEYIAEEIKNFFKKN